MSSATRFKLEVSEVYAMYNGAYMTGTIVVFGKSPKQCWERMRTHGPHQQYTGSYYRQQFGGTPVIGYHKLFRNGKKIQEAWD